MALIKDPDKSILEISGLKQMWVCIDKKNHPAFDSLSNYKEISINKLLTDSNMTWKEIKKYGWKCVKVNVSFDPC